MRRHRPVRSDLLKDSETALSRMARTESWAARLYPALAREADIAQFDKFYHWPDVKKFPARNSWPKNRIMKLMAATQSARRNRRRLISRRPAVRRIS